MDADKTHYRLFSFSLHCHFNSNHKGDSQRECDRDQKKKAHPQSKNQKTTIARRCEITHLFLEIDYPSTLFSLISFISLLEFDPLPWNHTDKLYSSLCCIVSPPPPPFFFRNCQIGKSSMIIQYVENVFAESYFPTIERTYTKPLTFRGQAYEIQIIDTAGQVRGQKKIKTKQSSIRLLSIFCKKKKKRTRLLISCY